ncbi:MAG: PAS domain S-box protein [Alphaproteobacteria bacterium]|nr:PAS domain S-box protein [Alphaproteobacteria bacterium]
MRSSHLSARLAAALRSRPHLAADVRKGSFWNYIDPEDVDTIKSAFSRLARDASVECRLQTTSGSRWILWKAYALTFDEEGRWLEAEATGIDISERLKIEEDLRLSNAKLREAEATLQQQAALLDKAHEGMIVRDLDHRIQFWNKGAERIFGWTREEAIGRPKHELLYDDPAIFHHANQHAFELGEWNGIVEQTRKDGRRIKVQANWTLICDSNGAPQSVFCIVSDVTDRLSLEEQLKQSQRLEAIGQLTGGVAHDFNNLLTVVLGNSEALVERLSDQPKLRHLAQITLSVAERGAELTHRLLAFSRRQALEPKSVDANDLLAGMAPLLKRTLPEDIDISFVAGPDLWPAVIDPSQLEAAVLNLCINARDAMPGGGRVVVETDNVHLDGDYAGQNAEVTAGEYVMVAVSDTGTGISPENLSRVFDPFFTTKEIGKGTGLGLSMVYGFVKQSRGHVKVYSEVDFGTVVKLYLPRSSSAPAIIEKHQAALADLAGTDKILLVEDDDLVRAHAESVLSALGYRVTVASNGPAALEVLQRDNTFDLLFTDVVMPGGMTGRMLADRAIVLKPGLRVLYTSGYTQNSVVHDGRLDEGVLLLSKPYSRLDLAQKVRAALDSPIK